jgi:hypothetical protein
MIIQMIHPTRILLTATFSLLSVLTVQAANTQLATTQSAKTSTIPISYLPFNITAPGTYVLTRNLTYNGGSSGTAITISTTVAGPVVLDLKGFTISAVNPVFTVEIGDTVPHSPNTYPITSETVQSKVAALEFVLFMQLT